MYGLGLIPSLGVLVCRLINCILLFQFYYEKRFLLNVNFRPELNKEASPAITFQFHEFHFAR